MDNFNSEWRVWAKAVAFFDLIVSIVFMLFIFLLLFVACFGTHAALIYKMEPPDVAFQVWLWLITAAFALSTIFSLWATVQLIRATELGREAKEAHKFCQPWHLLSAISIMFQFTAIDLMTSDIQTMMTIIIGITITTLIRGIFSYVVHRFVQDLKAIVGMPPQMKQLQNV